MPIWRSNRAKQMDAVSIASSNRGSRPAGQRRRQIEADLRSANRTGGLELRFQPIVGTSDTSIRCFEALLRWPHPIDGYISPVDFIRLRRRRA